MASPKADYGIDAPTVVRNLAISSIVGVISGVVLYAMMVPIRPVTGAMLSVAGFRSGLCLLFAAGLMVRSRKYGKLHQREHLIDAQSRGGSCKLESRKTLPIAWK